MSLINDALRRARQAPASTTESPPAGADASAPPPLETAEPPPLSPWATLLPMLLIGVVVMGLIGVGGWFAWKAWASKSACKPVAASALPGQTARGVSVTNLAVAKTNLSHALAVTNAVAVATTNKLPVASAARATNSVANVANSAPSPVKWPSLKLQGIFYKRSSPSVVINNKTLYLDDVVDGVRIVAIDLHQVTLVLGDKTNVMVLR